MKKTKLLLLSLFISAVAFGQMNSYQGRIDTAFGQSFASRQNQIEPIIKELQVDESTNAYWIAYGQFYQSIFFLQMGQKEEAEELVKDAIESLQNIENKNSEDHALLGYVLGYSIAFDPSGAGRLAAKAATEYKAALKKDEKNMRVYLGLGESDFHKPAAYGGGEKVEDYLLKAISLDEQSFENGPSWGKNLAYYVLANFYLRDGQTDKAKLYCMQGLNTYPQDFQLNQLKQSF